MITEVFSFEGIAKAVVLMLTFGCLFFVCSVKMIAALQQSNYGNGKFFSWYRRKDNLLKERFSLLFLLAGFSSALFAVCFSFLGAFAASVLSLVPMFFFLIAYRVCDFKYALKVPAKKTARWKRLSCAYAVVLCLLVFAAVILLHIIEYYAKNNLFSAMKYVPLSLFILLLPFILMAVNGVEGVFERYHNKKFLVSAKEKLQRADLIKIGITGSYAKTSVKNILKTILEEKYRVIATPASYNTPMGIAKCVNETDMSGVQVLIAEMGARHTGDIKELCELVEPDYAILTGICPQHLETFGSVENIFAEKTSILSFAKKGVVYPESVQADIPEEKKNCVIGKDIIVSDVSTSRKGTSFVLHLQGREISLKTKLLTSHSAENIALAAGMAIMLGLSEEEIICGVEKIDYIEHRLQVIESAGITIIDDSYNANIVGAKAAIEALKLFDGKKFVFTPGLVELGILEVKENENLGKELVGIDNVVLIGDTLVGAVKKGYLDNGGDAKKLTVVPTLTAAQKIIDEKVVSGDTILFLNDLPDVY